MNKKVPVFDTETLAGIRRGIEKESLRVSPSGVLSSKCHPAKLGSALTHPSITTDFSESQLELITQTHSSVEDCIRELTQIHKTVYENIEDELLWCSSMPCDLPREEAIPIGIYGASNIGRAKHVYRRGLSHRYGRKMQMISGIHYNFSIPENAWQILQKDVYSGESIEELRNHFYFALIRNFQREAWLLLYLFGGSPAVCKTFTEKKVHRLKNFKSGDMYLPEATSLRMGPLGYQSDVQSSIAVTYNTLNSYTRSLQAALTEPYPPYAYIGIKNGDSYNQLSTSLLQIENEFYSTIRPKRRIKPSERPLHALHNRGVEYVEIRAIDLDPYSELGISEDTIRFIDIFLLHCLLTDSPADSPKELVDIHHNQHVVAEYGRDPHTKIFRGDNLQTIKEWGTEIIEKCFPIATALDSANQTDKYSASLEIASRIIRNPENSISAKVLKDICNYHDQSFKNFTLHNSKKHKEKFKKLEYPSNIVNKDKGIAQKSLFRQRELEVESKTDFESYRKSYIDQTSSLEKSLKNMDG
ncbi:MAG: glutamate--cysteine ligase [Proteobacteria bacterium]|nr:glutamate--cysteine ligase [Pseudomonadota bacterium]